MTPTTTPHKQAKAEAIVRCITTICRFYGADPAKLINPAQVRSNAGMQARAALVYHLYRSGMSFHAIGRILHRSEDAIRRYEREGAIRMMGEDRKMIEGLPVIPNSLQLTHP